MGIAAEYLDELIPENAHALLKAVYQCTEVPLSVRMRAAMACLPFETPKLAITAQVSEGNFADLLDRRLKRLAEMKLIEANGAKVIDQSEAKPQVETKPPLGRTPDRRFRRF
jgi:hypothetical protein